MKKLFRIIVVAVFVILGTYAAIPNAYVVDPNHINKPGKMWVRGNLLAVL